MAELMLDPNATGPLLLLRHGYDLALTLAMVAACCAVGAGALRWFRLTGVRPTESLLFALPLGAGVLSLGILLLGAVGALQPGWIATLLAVSILAVPGELLALPQRIRQAASELHHRAGDEIGVFALLVSGLAVVFMLTFALAPSVDYDSLMYHLRLPEQFLSRGRIFLPEDNLRVSYANVVHMLYVPLLAGGSSTGPAVLSAIFAAWLGVAMFSFASRFFSGTTGAVSAALLWTTTTIPLVATTPRVDVTIALFVFLAHYALALAWRERSRGAFYLSAVLLGLAVGVKFHALPYILALSPFVVLAGFRIGGGMRGFAAGLSVFGALVIVAAAPWLIKNWMLLGAPFYPILSAPLLPPWLGSLLGSRVVPPGVNPDILNIIWDSRAAFNLHDVFLAPARLNIDLEGRHYYVSPALALAPVALVLARNPVVLSLLLTGGAYAAILLLSSSHTNVRYFLPAVPPLTIAVAYLIARGTDRWLPARAGAGALVVVIAVSLVPSLRAGHSWLREQRAGSHLRGDMSAERYLSANPRMHWYQPVTRYLNDSLESSDRVLMLFEGRGFGLTPQVLEDHNAIVWPILAATRGLTDDCLARTGLTHVLWGYGQADYLIAGGADSTVLGLPEFREFAGRCLARIYRTDSHELYRVHGARPDQR